jgi:hypothetical protein
MSKNLNQLTIRKRFFRKRYYAILRHSENNLRIKYFLNISRNKQGKIVCQSILQVILKYYLKHEQQCFIRYLFELLQKRSI